MNRTFRSVAGPWVLAMLIACPLFAQATVTSTISGVVTDTAGGTIPGVAVVAKNEAGATFDTVTNAEGVFALPSMNAGTYVLTVSLNGFKTAVVSNVSVRPGVPASVKVVLEVGGLEETVNVQSSTELINSQTPTISSTLNADELNRMPTPTRNALNAVTFLPGVNTATTNRESRINGLPETFINITLDGVSNNDNFLRSTDSFFASVTPRQDAVEAVSVTTAAAGAELGGSGAVTINFATRSGTNQLSGSAYEYWRDTSLNSNYWFNKRDGLPRNDVKLNQYGGRLGGPIVIPGLYDGHNKAFFFFHYEQLRFPNSFSRTRTVLSPRALDGWFRYEGPGGQVREVNVLSLAAANGQISAIDPTVRDLLNRIQTSMTTTGAVTPTSDPLLDSYVWLSPGSLFEHQPTLRIDYNINDKHRLSGSTQMIWSERDPDYLNNADVRFPGAPNFRFFHSFRPLHSISLRSTLSSTIVNQVRGGITALGGASYFGDPSSNGPQTFQDQRGYAIDFDTNIGLTNWFTENGPSWRSAPTFEIADTLSWLKGTHSLSLGGSWLRSSAWENAQQIVTGINLGFDTTNDPAVGLFTTTNFPNATAANLTDARELYSLLTGRVTAVTGQAALDPSSNTYAAFAPRRREGRIDMYSGFIQDSWRMTPTFTLNGGVRYDLQMPFVPVNDVMSTVTLESICGVSGLGSGGTYNRCNLFQPGASGGVNPEFIQFTRGTKGYETDKNNFSPNVGFAWRPNVQGGWLRALLGDPEQATLRAGYSVAYERHGLSDWTGVYGLNPGSTLSLTRNASTGLVPAGQSWPVLLSQPDRLFNAPFPESPTYPIAIRPNRADNINGFAPDLKIGYAGTWTVSFQRSISRDMAVDIRYVGTRGWSQWSTLNYNTLRMENLLNNHFLDEFKLAMANLTANNAAGGTRTGSFAYFGSGTGTSPLPIYLAYLNGRTDATNAAAYTGGTQTWTNTAITQDLVRVNPQPVNSANDLDGNLTRRQNALSAGLPANFFVGNPDANQVNVTDSGAFSDYHAFQVELRRRLSRGLSTNVNYQYAIEGGSAFDGFSFGRVMDPTENVRHAFKVQWDWQVPVGQGQRYGSSFGHILNGVLGGWSVNGVGRIQSRVIDFGNVRLVGMTLDELTKVYKHEVRANPSTGLGTVYNLPQDLIDNTRRAFNVDPSSATGYSSLGVPTGRYFAPDNSADCIEIRNGDCAPRTVMVRTPWFTRFDIGITKRFPIQGSFNFEVRFDLLNIFDNVNFTPFDYQDISNTLLTAYSSATFGQVTTAYRDPSNTYDPGGRIGQLMLRVNW